MNAINFSKIIILFENIQNNQIRYEYNLNQFVSNINYNVNLLIKQLEENGGSFFEFYYQTYRII